MPLTTTLIRCALVAVAVPGVAVLAQGGRSSGTSLAEQQVRAVEEAWTAAEVKADVAALGRILADEFVNYNEAGKQIDKSQTLAMFAGGQLQVAGGHSEDMRVRVYGDVSVVTMRYLQSGMEQGRPINGDLQIMDVFVRRDGRWQCVAEQATKVPR
jgi:ketosteroid isomerase-like protein